MRFFITLFVSTLTLTTFADKKPTVILVHGALFTSAGWSLVQSQLQNDGQNVVTLDVPGRAGDGLSPLDIDIGTAADKLCKVINSVDGPVYLAGHSQGGAVITQAAGNCGKNVKGLIYVAAVVPLDGETAFQGLNPKKDVNFSKCATLDEKQRLFRLNKKGPLEKSFFADVRKHNPALADLALASMVSEPAGIGTTPLHYDSETFKKLPKYYIETLQDQVVTLDTQRSYQKKVDFIKVYSVDASHSPFLSKPKELANILKEILN